jgi:hypothetical protein
MAVSTKPPLSRRIGLRSVPSRPKSAAKQTLSRPGSIDAFDPKQTIASAPMHGFGDVLRCCSLQGPFDQSGGKPRRFKRTPGS